MARRQAHGPFGLADWMAVIVACLLISGCGAKTPGDVVQEFEMLIAEGKFEAAAKHVPSSDREMFMMGAAMAGGFSELFGMGEPRRVEITREDIYGNEADVAYVIHYKDGSSSWEEWEHLVKVGGKWRISLY